MYHGQVIGLTHVWLLFQSDLVSLVVNITLSRRLQSLTWWPRSVLPWRFVRQFTVHLRFSVHQITLESSVVPTNTQKSDPTGWDSRKMAKKIDCACSAIFSAILRTTLLLWRRILLPRFLDGDRVDSPATDWELIIMKNNIQCWPGYLTSEQISCRTREIISYFQAFVYCSVYYIEK